MSQQELVAAFLDRRISRRTLVRRLIAGGVSTGAAISYAQMLDPQRASAITSSDQYPLVDLSIANTTFATVKNASPPAVRVLVVTSEEIRQATFRAFFKVNGSGVVIGQKTFGLTPTSGPLIKQAGSTTIKIPINVAALGTATNGTFYVQLQGFDAERFPSLASTSKTLS
jgi:hypothetical protein